jgi:hypothetical protein
MKQKLYALVCLLTALVVPSLAQNTFKSFFDPVDYSKWQMVIYASVASGAQTVQVSYPGSTANTGSQTACTFTAVNGRTFSPFAVGTPVSINDATRRR